MNWEYVFIQISFHNFAILQFLSYYHLTLLYAFIIVFEMSKTYRVFFSFSFSFLFFSFFFLANLSTQIKLLLIGNNLQSAPSSCDAKSKFFSDEVKCVTQSF